MFKCSCCYKNSKPGESATKRVVETRIKQYPVRKNAHSNGNDDLGGVGTEIVKEIFLCTECAKLNLE
jgi:hypothetical protein